MPKLTISEAARRAGVQRSTLYRRAAKGELSLELAADGSRCVDLSELLRVYPDAQQDPMSAPDASHRSKHRMQRNPDSEALRLELELLRHQAQELRADKEDLRRRLGAAEAERRETQQQLRLLADQRRQHQRPQWTWPKIKAAWRQFWQGEG